MARPTSIGDHLPHVRPPKFCAAERPVRGSKKTFASDGPTELASERDRRHLDPPPSTFAPELLLELDPTFALALPLLTTSSPTTCMPNFPKLSSWLWPFWVCQNQPDLPYFSL